MVEKSIKLANPRGFCAGVDRAIEIVNRAIDIFNAPIYVRHQVVHNRFVVQDLNKRGAVFVKELDEVPDNSTVVFSAHGVSRSVQQQAKQRQLKVLDATCPLVTKVHLEVIKYSREGYSCVLIGHEGHPEVIGTMGQFDTTNGGCIYLVENVEAALQLQPKNTEKIAYVTQTTLSIDDTKKIIEALRQKFPNIVGPRSSDICYATQNRQDAVRQLALESDIVLVVGSKNSSNSNRLRELAERCGCYAKMIDCAEEIDNGWFTNRQIIGITAGASAPESTVQSIVNYCQEQGYNIVQELDGIKEDVNFSLPKVLR